MPMSKHQRPGMDDSQRRLRATLGIDIPRDPPPKPVLVDGIVALVCEHCGCTNARTMNAKDRTCGFCGKRQKSDQGQHWSAPSP